MLHKGNSTWKRGFIRFAVLFSLVLFSQAVLAQQSVTLTWSPGTDAAVAGYKIYYGTVSHDYTNVVDVGNVTTATISGLADSTTYYFAATTYDASGDESAFSNEAFFTTAAAVTNVITSPVTNSISSTTTNSTTTSTVTNSTSSPTNSITPPAAVSNNVTTVVINENSVSQTIVLSNVPAIESVFTSVNSKPVTKTSPKTVLTVSVATSDSKLIPKPSITSSSTTNPGKMVFKPVAGTSGAAVITVTVSSKTGSAKTVAVASEIFNMTVMPSPLDYPRLSKKLTNNVVLTGKTVTLSMSAAGRAPLKYQWMLNGVSIPSATSDKLTLKSVKASQSGNYSVMVYNTLGVTNSAPALLAIQSTTAAHLTSMPATAGKFNFQIGGINGTKYIVEASADMKTWVPVQTNTAPFNFTDANSGNFKQRFYRTKTF